MKINFFVVTFILTCLLQNSFAQSNEAILFTLDNEPITASEFIRVYNKNLDLVKDESQKDVDQYLKLFVNYKLKIKEAKELGYDEKPAYKREFENYRKQLSKNYLTDHKASEELISEAYQRSIYDVKVSHVLIRLDAHIKDTADVYENMLVYKKRLQEEDFETIKKSLPASGDVIAEDLGYFSAFKMVYNFESVAYNTPVGEVSDPFRTSFGYHVLKVHDKRPSRGEVTVGHIMLTNSANDSIEDPAIKIQEIYRLLQQGEAFESLAKQFSQDKSSANNGGKLRPFKGGQLNSVIFEEKAFGLKEIGQVTEPFQSEYGWHIAKLFNKKGVPSFEEAKIQLEQRVKRDARSQVITNVFIDSLKTVYNIDTNSDLTYFKSIIDKNYFSNSWSIPEDLPKEKSLVLIDKKQLTYEDFANFLRGRQKRIRTEQPIDILVENQYKDFVNEQLLAYHEANLENVNQEYANVLSEYRDGLLLFDLMQEKVWQAAQKDTVELENYYYSNKVKYFWPERIEAVIATSSDAEFAALAKQGMENNTPNDQLKEEINQNDKQNIIFTTGKFEHGDRVLPENFKFKKGVSKIYNYNNAYHVINVVDVIPSKQKSFEEARGNVITDYQGEFEKQWMESLHEKYKINLNEEVFTQIKAQINK